MSKYNFDLQSSLDANYLNISMDEDAVLDEIAMKVMKTDCPDFLIPFHMVNMNDTVTLKYKLVNAIALEYAGMTMQKDNFIEMYMALVTPFIKAKEWLLDYHYLCINPSYVYLNKTATEVYYIYVPERTFRNTDEDIFHYLQNVLNSVSIIDDSAFLVQLYQYFNKGNVTLIDLYKMLQNEKNKIMGRASVSRAIPQPVSVQSVVEQQVAAKPMVVQPAPVQKIAVEPPKAELPLKGNSVSAEQNNVAASLETEPAKGKEKSKKGGKLFGKASEEKQDDFFASLSAADNSFEDALSSDDEVMNMLFGDKKKEKKVKEKKVKEKQVKEKPAKETKVKEKQSLFKKKTVDAPEVSPEVPYTPAAAGNQAMRVNPVSANPYEPVLQPSDYICAQQDFMMSGETTEIFEDNSAYIGGFLQLVESPIPGAPRRISLAFDKPYITIGRTSSDAVKADVLFGSEFRRIGRMHARIEKRNDAYYVIDLGSANHTLLNGQILIPNNPYLLQNGAELAFTVSQPVKYKVNI